MENGSPGCRNVSGGILYHLLKTKEFAAVCGERELCCLPVEFIFLNFVFTVRPHQKQFFFSFRFPLDIDRGKSIFCYRLFEERLLL